jgi:predicted GNAT family acetyltransferase
MIFHDTGRLRFEQEENGKLVHASYRLRDGVYDLVHVEADEALRGTGAADRFMRALVEHARAHGLKFAPRCPYARVWFGRHPDAADLLAGDP